MAAHPRGKSKTGGVRAWWYRVISSCRCCSHPSRRQPVGPVSARARLRVPITGVRRAAAWGCGARTASAAGRLEPPPPPHPPPPLFVSAVARFHVMSGVL